MVDIKTFKKITVLAFILLIPYCIIAYNHIGEDCFISFRYAENLAAGKGLVYNEGEFVEGYSNFLWTIILSYFSLIGLNIVSVGKALSVLSYALMIFPAAFFFIHPGQKKVHSSRGLVIALMFFNPMLHYHADRALETNFYALLLLCAMYYLKRRRAFVSSMFYLAAALTRPEGFVYFFAGAFLPFADAYRLYVKERKNINWVKTLSIKDFFIPFIIGFGVFISWRLYVYGHLFPNTVYAKVNKWNFLHNPSIGDLWLLTRSWSLLPLIAVVSFIFLLRVKKGVREKKGVFLIGATSLLIIVYNIYIGKVMAEPLRHLVPIIPIFIILIGEAFRQLADRIKSSWKMWVIAVFIGSINFWTIDNYDAPKSRLHIRTFQFLMKWDFIERTKWFFSPPIFLNAEAGRELKKLIPHDSLAVAEQMGQMGYYSGLRLIDCLGLMDSHIAHFGYSNEYIFKRNPDYFILYSNKGVPYIPFLAELIKDPEFKLKYTCMYILKWQFDSNEYVVYGRRKFIDARADKGDYPKTIYVGVSKEEFLEKWRI